MRGFGKAGQQDTNNPPAGAATQWHFASAARAYLVRTGGKVGLPVPIHSRPLSAEVAGVSPRTGGNVEFIVPIRTLALSRVVDLRRLQFSLG